MTFEEQVMSKDKYPSIFSCKMEAIVFTILQIFFQIVLAGRYSVTKCVWTKRARAKIFDGL